MEEGCQLMLAMLGVGECWKEECGQGMGECREEEEC